VNSTQVNWQPGSVLKISGAPWRQIASHTASRQKSVVRVSDRRHVSTFLEDQSTTATR